MNSLFRKNRPDAVAAFGGYVCAPVLAAARQNKIPYFLQEQNSVPGLVNRTFASKAESSFLGYPLSGKYTLKGKCVITGTPIRTVENSFDTFEYPQSFDKNKITVFICGGSQGAASMNDCLISPMEKAAGNGIQLLWQTGSFSYEKIAERFAGYTNAFIFESIDDMYPYYAASDIVICRSGASTLNEIAYFGLPCITIPLPWAAENHQWMNAGYVQHAGWGIRVAQDKNCSAGVEKALYNLIEDKKGYENKCRKALDNSPEGAAALIAKEILGHFINAKGADHER
jgi:UDP-N-acetylglucosamine--N-acetylmuramyl-(pentapeptide) pyrophosphoryl-undecaprenol N-acetylglucosamine transferase